MSSSTTACRSPTWSSTALTRSTSWPSASTSSRTVRPSGIDLTENDLVFITNGGCVENSSMGSQDKPAAYNTELKEGGGWDMWRKIAAQDPSFGHPDKFCS